MSLIEFVQDFEGAAMSRRAEIRHVIILIIISLVTWIPRYRGPIDLRSDAGVYYILGTAISEGKGYRLLNEPGDLRAVQYPPLLPAIVAGHQLVLGTKDYFVVGSWLKFTYAGFSTLYAVAIYVLARQYLAPGYSLLVALITILNPNTMSYTELLYAELPFSLLTVLFALSNRRDDQKTFSITTSLLGMAAYLMRSAGITLLAAWVGEALLKGRWRQAAVRTGIVLLPIVAWQSYIGRVKSGEEYRHRAYVYQRAPYNFNNVTYIENIMLVDPFAPELGVLTPGAFAARITSNSAIAPEQLGRLVPGGRQLRQSLSIVFRRLGLRDSMLDKVVDLFVGLEGLVLLGGIGLFLSRREWLIPLYIGASLALTCILPWSEGFQRYLTPLQPYLFLSLIGLLSGFAGLTHRSWRGSWRLVGPAVLILVSTIILLKEIRADAWGLWVTRTPVFQGSGRERVDGYKLLRYSEASYKLDEALDWLKGHAGAGEVVATQVPHWAYLKIGMKAIFPPMEIDPAEAQRLLDSVPVDYLLLDQTDILTVTPKYAEPVIRAFPGRWSLIYTAPGSRTSIYRRRQPPPVLPSVGM